MRTTIMYLLLPSDILGNVVQSYSITNAVTLYNYHFNTCDT